MHMYMQKTFSVVGNIPLWISGNDGSNDDTARGIMAMRGKNINNTITIKSTKSSLRWLQQQELLELHS